MNSIQCDVWLYDAKESGYGPGGLAPIHSVDIGNDLHSVAFMASNHVERDVCKREWGLQKTNCENKFSNERGGGEHRFA